MMKKCLLLVAAGLAASAALAQGQERLIQVQVVGGKIQVPEQVAVVKRSHAAIRWQISTPGHSFPDNGIVIQDAGDAIHGCKPTHQGASFTCLRRGHVAGQRYKYDVNVRQGDKALPTLDPIIQNE